MGTYLHARLKKTDEANIQKANESIQKAGYPITIYNDVPYGFFISRAQLEEDARFMNEDPEGRKQVPSWPRPVTAEMLTADFFWLEIGCGCIKLSGCDHEQQALVDIVHEWLETPEAKRMIKSVKDR